MPEEIIVDYIKAALVSKYTDLTIQETGTAYTDEEDTEFYTTHKSNLDYVILVAKLEAFVNVIDIIKIDKNIVMVDELENELVVFKEKMLKSIEETIELINNEENTGI